MLTQIVFLINLFFAIQHVLSLWLFSVIKYRPQKIVLPACPGDLPACPPKRTKVKGKCAGVPSIYSLQPETAHIWANAGAVSILGFENCQSFFSHNCPCMYGAPQCAARRTAMRGAPQCAAHRNARRTAMRGAPQCAACTSLIGTTLAKLSKQLRNITYRQLFNKHTILSCLFIKMVVYCNKQLCK